MPRHALAAAAAARIRESGLARQGALVVAAVSGGPDSLAMLHALAGLRGELGFGLHVAHLDHRLRGEESAAEASFVAEAALALGVPATVASADVAALALARGQNLYAAGRSERYALLARVAGEVGAHAVAVAHTADDQAETVLMHLLRGAGADGLSGMRGWVAWGEWRRYAEPGEAPDLPEPGPALVRPLLGVPRAEVESYCAANGLAPRRDPSNDDMRHARARVRHALIPQLIAYNPRIVASLCRTAEALAADQELVEQLLDQAWPSLVSVRPGGVDLAAPAWTALPLALRRAAIRRAYVIAGGRATLGLDDVERVARAAARGPGRTIELPGGLAALTAPGLLRFGAAPPARGPQLTGGEQVLAVPGAVALDGGWRIESGLASAYQGGPAVWLDQAALAGGLAVRVRQPGDRVRRAGGRGSRRVQDVMVDRRVPRELRARWPLLVSGEAVRWVAGVCAGEGCRVAPPGDVWVRLAGPSGEPWEAGQKETEE
jgi:tRNA(Ile)-lysidine synthetase-like protein